MKIHLNLNKVNQDKLKINSEIARAKDIIAELKEDKEAYTGWVNQPAQIPAAELDAIIECAERIRGLCEVLVVIGIGGSYLGSAAVVEALGGSAAGCPELVFAGNNLSGNYHSRFAQIVKEHEICLCVVSKSGETMESKLGFSLLKELMYEKYGEEETARRIVAITDPAKGSLRAEAEANGYATFPIPSNIGGRYSAYTAGIMLPLAVAGVDIRAFVKGAADIQLDEAFWANEGMYYALTRYALLESGKQAEVFEYYDPSLRLIGEWCKQLFGESEGKEGKGLLPVSLIFSTDLHSMGQFLQEGSQIFFETVLNVLNRDKDVIVPESAGELLAGKSLNAINQMAIEGVIAAHSKTGIPIVQIEMDSCDEYCIGQLFYFFMLTAAITGKLMGVDPFNQPGVEDYKSEIRSLLGQ